MTGRRRSLTILKRQIIITSVFSVPPDDWTDRIVITCDVGYKRVEDIIIQTRLVTDGKVKVSVVDDADKSVKTHYNNICKAIEKFE